MLASYLEETCNLSEPPRYCERLPVKVASLSSYEKGDPNFVK